MKFQTRKVARESCGNSYLRVAAPVILGVATLFASSEGLAQTARAHSPVVASAPARHSPRRLAVNPRPASVAPAVRNPVAPTTPAHVVQPASAASAVSRETTPAPVNAVPEAVTIGGVRFTVLNLPISMTQLETESARYRFNSGEFVNGELLRPDRYGNIAEGNGFRAVYTIQTDVRSFGMQYRNANGGDSMLVRAVTEFENAMTSIIGQPVSRVRLYVRRDTMEVANDSCGGCIRPEAVVSVFAVPADPQTGQPSVQHVENGRTGYPAFAYTYFTQQAYVSRGYYWIVPSQ